MHNHGGGGGGEGFLNILPLWVQVLWTVLLAAVTAGHLLTVGFARAEARVWSGAHALMGVGMIYMFLPWSGEPPVPAGALVVVFGFAAVVSLLALAGDWNSARPVRLIWILVTVDMAAMAYMFQLVDRGAWLLTYALVAWYLAAAIGWSYGVADPSLTRCCAVPFGAAEPIPPLPLARAGQAVMATAMAWMFLAMDPHAGSFFDHALRHGITEDTYWLAAFAGLFLRVATDPKLVRALAGPAWGASAPRAWSEARRPGRVDQLLEVEPAGVADAGAVQLAHEKARHVPLDLFVHAGDGAQEVRP